MYEQIKEYIRKAVFEGEVKNNDIKFWGLEELFAEAQIYGCTIPAELESDFDLYRRKTSPKRTNPYVVEPFLRRNSWMLLSEKPISHGTFS